MTIFRLENTWALDGRGLAFAVCLILLKRCSARGSACIKQRQRFVGAMLKNPTANTSINDERYALHHPRAWAGGA